MAISIKQQFEELISVEYKSAIFSASQIAEKYNIKIYLIGGIVRDLILKNQIKDIDIAVEADAIEFANLLEKETDCEVIAIQENLRTAKVKFKNGVEIDFASTREETYTKSGVLPVAHNFGCSLEKDVKRRDFAINTLGLKLTGNDKFTLVDYFNGYKDILNKKIRILHDKSFIDDPSRIIRALKFKVRFDFEFEEQTFTLMQDYLNNVDKTMPLERIKSELKQYFSIQKKGLYNYLIETNAYKLISNNPIKEVDETTFQNEENLWFIYFVLLLVNGEYDERLNLASIEKKILLEVKEMLNRKTPNSNLEIYNEYIDKNDVSLNVYYVISKDKTVEKFLNALKQIKVLITGK
ncbi:MAG: CCA tRNA nucleotidyltransferase, partial [Clostridia bacterium]|nr:CCA tRNA nucleotidyltransferase [Clostridia bacterium]